MQEIAEAEEKDFLNLRMNHIALSSGMSSTAGNCNE